MTAAQTYDQVQEEIQAQIKKLQAALIKHADKNNGSIHWGHVGDLQKTSSDLKDILSFLA